MKTININNIKPLCKKSIVTVGMFDGLHVGHRHILNLLLARSRELDAIPVVVTFDCHPRVVLGLTDNHFRQLQTTNERITALEEFGVEIVAIAEFSKDMAQLSACEFAQKYLVEKLNMGTLLVGYDNMFGNKTHNDFHLLPELAREFGFRIESDSAVLIDGAEVSSTQIRRALEVGDIRSANAMLGASYPLSGVVVHGRHVGRTIGFPTANLELFDPYKAVPEPGVYAVWVQRSQKRYKGMANIGPRPTFAVDKYAIEVHLIDFNDDIYGEVLRIEFVHRLRDIVRFASVEELIGQLNNDREEIKKLLKP